MKLRNLATPLSGATFLVMAATGVLMFFHLETPLGKELHEWLGWAMVAGVVLHLVTNWKALTLHLGRTPGRVLAVVGVATLLVAVVPLSRGAGGGNPTAGVMQNVERAPLAVLAPIAKKDVTALVGELQQAGFTAATPDSTPASLGGEGREGRGRVLSVIFAAKAP